ncbi:hypothetical protein MMC19_002424 [Ptychographa xylographoides]|nr:hypothetical protein [Ptychographa xylographoides]
MFPSLRELDISGYPKSLVDIYHSTPEINPLRYLRKLRIDQLHDATIVPYLFFLPSLDALELTALDVNGTVVWTLPPNAMTGCSKVTNLALIAHLTPFQLLQILSWPFVLEKFAYTDRVEYHGCTTQALTVQIISAALQSFLHTLTSLKICCEKPRSDTGDDMSLNLSSFSKLQFVHLPSDLFFGLPGASYDRSILPLLLPVSLRNFEITFNSRDRVFNRGWSGWGWTTHQAVYGNGAIDKSKWLGELVNECYPWGRLPKLEKVYVRDEGATKPWPLPQSLSNILLDRNVNLVVELCAAHHELGNDQDAGSPCCYSCGTRHEEEYLVEACVYGDAGGPIFRDDFTVYSDSPRASEDEDESDVADSVLEDEAWEQLDGRMMQEKGNLWKTGAWPDYERSREEREELFRYKVYVHGGRRYW